MKGSKAPVYVVKPKNVFKHPFNKFDLDKPTNRETQNQDLTDYFNYGFNEDTMNIYGKLVKKTIETLDENINSTYFDEPSKLMRLNDQIPMDFGGFCKFFDTSVFGNPEDSESRLQNMQHFHNGEELFEYFIYQILKTKPEYPLIDFVRSLYPPPEEQRGDDDVIWDIMEQIQKNLERKYQDMMVRLEQKKNSLAPVQPQKPEGKSKRSKPTEAKKQQQSGSSSDESSGSSSSSDSSSDDSSESSNYRRRRKEKERSRQKSRRRSHKESSRSHRKKRSKSRDRRKKKHRQESERHRKKDRKHRSRDRSSRKKRRH